MYAKEFGWHPEIVDNLSLTSDIYLIPISRAIDAETEKRRQAAQKKAAKQAQ